LFFESLFLLILFSVPKLRKIIHWIGIYAQKNFAQPFQIAGFVFVETFESLCKRLPIIFRIHLGVFPVAVEHIVRHVIVWEETVSHVDTTVDYFGDRFVELVVSHAVERQKFCRGKRLANLKMHPSFGLQNAREDAR
jgi:hypothetical protein